MNTVIQEEEAEKHDEKASENDCNHKIQSLPSNFSTTNTQTAYLPETDELLMSRLGLMNQAV